MRELKHIHLIGGEIELGATYERNDLEDDLGVKLGDFKNAVCCGEAIIKKPLNSVEKVAEWIEFNYKKDQTKPYDFKDNNGIIVQHMTGTHWHFSFTSVEAYISLMSPKFHKYFLKFMKDWGEGYPIQNQEFWNRLEDRNKFCRNKFTPEEQIFLKKKIPNDPGRYSQIHFSYGLYKTLEIRLMPTFVTLDTAISGFLACVDCIEGYLAENPPVPIDFNKEFNFDDIEEITKIYDTKKFRPEIKPFNLFMVKGMVATKKYGLPELEKQDKKVERAAKQNKGYGIYDIIDDGAFYQKEANHNEQMPDNIKAQFLKTKQQKTNWLISENHEYKMVYTPDKDIEKEDPNF